MVQKIALFNHKGGVSKTTTTFNLGWMLASKGKTVILVDADPQCNLTGIALGQGTESDEERIAQIYSARSNIRTSLAPAFESQPRSIQPVDCVTVEGVSNLFLMPGSVGFAEYEVTLGIAQQMSSSIQALRNVPGSLNDVLEKTAQKFEADYILIDMSPSLNSINQNLLMISDFFIVPTSADFFSLMAIDSLAKVLPKWYVWRTQMCSISVFREADYPFPNIVPRFMGTIVQNFRIIGGKETKAFEKWIQRIENDVETKLAPILRASEMMLETSSYRKLNVPDNFTLTKIANFNSLIALSQEHQTPVYALTAQQLGQRGVVLKNNQAKQESFRQTFDDLANKVVGLASEEYAISA